MKKFEPEESPRSLPMLAMCAYVQTESLDDSMLLVMEKVRNIDKCIQNIEIVL